MLKKSYFFSNASDGFLQKKIDISLIISLKLFHDGTYITLNRLKQSSKQKRRDIIYQQPFEP